MPGQDNPRPRQRAQQHARQRIRLGRIGYLNVLPLHHPLESGILRGDFDIISGPPAELNALMDQGLLDLSGCSSIEYAQRPDKYLLVPNLAIGSRGPVKSVLLLCRTRPEDLDAKTVLVSAATHTSAALLNLLLTQQVGVRPLYEIGDASSVLADGKRPEAILCIGDEALNLRQHPDYPGRMDLGEAWRQWTGLPFIFGVWIARRDVLARRREEILAGARLLLAAKAWGQKHMDEIATLAAGQVKMDKAGMRAYFDGLVYDLGPEELAGLTLFYKMLAKAGVIASEPELEFLPLD